MVGDLPDYEKKVIVVTVPGEYPGLIDINHKKILGVELKTPSIAACLPISIEHTVYIDHRAILGEALKSPTFANCVPTSIENDAIAYDDVNDRFKVDIEAVTVGTIDVNPTDKWTRQLGLVDLSRVLGAALAHGNPVIVRLTNGTTWLDPTQIRALTSADAITVYGSLDKLQQRATSKDLYVQLRSAGVEVDPTQIRALTNSDVVSAEQSDETKLKATVTQAAKDRTISSVDATATPLQINITGLNGNSSALVTPASGKKIRVKFISLEHSAAVDIGYRFGAAGTIYYLRITAGVYVSNLIGCNNEGSADAALYLNSSGATNVKGYILYSEV